MKKAAVAAFALLAVLLASVLMPCALTAQDSSSPILGASSSANSGSDSHDLAEGKGGVEGKVMMRNSPVEDYTITFEKVEFNEENEMSLTGLKYTKEITSTSGEYAVQLSPGQYSAKAISTSKEVVTYPTTIKITEGQWKSGIDFQFVNSYSFHGNVSYSGMKLSGVNVSLTPIGENTKNVTQTDSDGHYQFNGLTGGVYELLFQKDGFADERQIIDIIVQPYFNTSMMRTGLPGINGFILEYDFQHSMMVVGLVGMIVMIAISLAVRYYLTRNPNMILNDDVKEKSEE